MSPKPPSEPPDVEWFSSGIIKRRKFDSYLLNPAHPKGQHKARLWRSFFDLGQGDGETLERLIREQLSQAKPVEKEPKKEIRRWQLDISAFKGPNGNVAPVRTSWALDPANDRPHLSTAFPLPGQ